MNPDPDQVLMTEEVNTAVKNYLLFLSKLAFCEIFIFLWVIFAHPVVISDLKLTKFAKNMANPRKNTNEHSM